MRSRAPLGSTFAMVAMGAIALLCPGSRASAQVASAPPPKSRARFEVDARLAYGAPFGDLARNSPLSDSIALQVPIAVGAGLRVPGGTFFGVSLAYGVLAVKEGSLACPAGWSKCGGHHIRLGLDFLFHLRSRKAVDPWLGFAIGYQWLSYHATLEQSRGDLTDTITLRGTVLGSFHVGVDFALDEAWSLGPFLQVTGSQFDDYTAERRGAATATVSGSGAGNVAGWVFLGVRGAFSGF
jgi:hypothetical protein